MSLLAIWLIGAVALSPPDLWEYDEQLGMVIHAPYTVQADRNEGWGRTRFGAHGAQGLESVPPGADPKVCFLGDSYVQGGQVALAEHFYNVYNRTIADDNYAVAYGFSGRACAIHFEMMRQLPHVFPHIHTYVLFVGVDDILPNGTSQRLQPPKFIYQPRPRPLEQYREPLYEVRANFVWETLKLAKQSMDTFRFTPGPVSEEDPEAASEGNVSSAYREFWKALLETTVCAAGERHLLIAIKEMLPTVSDGHIVEAIDRKETLDAFVDVAEQLHIPVIDMRPISLQHFEETGEFSKGFVYTYPGEGHWNVTGHQLVAETMKAYFSARPSDASEDRGGPK